MPRPPLPRPTDAELAILGVLWKHGPLTVRQIHQFLKGTDTGYTSTLKLIQIMTEKKLLLRDENTRPAIYTPAEAPGKTKCHLITDLMNRAFNGSAANLVMQALGTKRATREELEEIRKRLDELELEENQQHEELR